MGRFSDVEAALLPIMRRNRGRQDRCPRTSSVRYAQHRLDRRPVAANESVHATASRPRRAAGERVTRAAKNSYATPAYCLFSVSRRRLVRLRGPCAARSRWRPRASDARAHRAIGARRCARANMPLRSNSFSSSVASRTASFRRARGRHHQSQPSGRRMDRASTELCSEFCPTRADIGHIRNVFGRKGFNRSRECGFARSRCRQSAAAEVNRAVGH